MNTQSRPNCRLEYDDEGIAWLYLDRRDADTNTLSLTLLNELSGALEELEQKRDLRGMVLLSAKSEGFVDGPSTEELETIDDEDRVRKLIECGQSVTGRIAALPVPTVAMIHGNCLNGGLDLALACRYRLAKRAGARLGFPDVRLGLHPAYGGTARLPDVVGYWQALELLRDGGSMVASRAVKLGLVDAVAAEDSLRDEACDLIRRNPGPHCPARWNLLLRASIIRRVIYKVLDYELSRKPCPENFPGTYAILRLWRDHAGKPMAQRLAAERNSFVALTHQPASRNLVRTYLLQNRLRTEALSLDVPVPRCVHVFGAGVIGAGVAALLAAHDREVTLHDPSEEALQAAEAGARKIFAERLGDEEAVAEAGNRLHLDADGNGIGDAELVIEAIGEDMAAKQSLLGDLETALGKDTVIATTTSTLSIEELCRTMDWPQRLIGLHFLDPVQQMPMVEVVAGEQSSERAVAAGQALIASVHKLALRVRSGPGRLVLRLELPYMLQGASGYHRTRREIIDAAGRKFGMAHGPLELADAVGLDVCQCLAEQLGYPVPDELRERVEAGRLGRRTGQGFHDWHGGRRVSIGVPPGRHPFKELARELIDPLLKEAVRCRDEQVVADGDLVDVGALFGAGFPAYTGGPLTWLDSRGGS
ncbi:MAG: 3-hydroxyacyl-CoA dehydrogenase NAD-binding domain-containing protein [Gammaproteobacteria bacterium]|nr:3-hydroxyacyl-CoA dehydrogenase NAD-binding domain-containing protein [Gammaproteobacteria bacterium]